MIPEGVSCKLFSMNDIQMSESADLAKEGSGVSNVSQIVPLLFPRATEGLNARLETRV